MRGDGGAECVLLDSHISISISTVEFGELNPLSSELVRALPSFARGFIMFQWADDGVSVC